VPSGRTRDQSLPGREDDRAGSSFSDQWKPPTEGWTTGFVYGVTRGSPCSSRCFRASSNDIRTLHMSSIRAGIENLVGELALQAGVTGHELLELVEASQVGGGERLEAALGQVGKLGPQFVAQELELLHHHASKITHTPASLSGGCDGPCFTAMPRYVRHRA
jgi:hypothetical protein